MKGENCPAPASVISLAVCLEVHSVYESTRAVLRLRFLPKCNRLEIKPKLKRNSNFWDSESCLVASGDFNVFVLGLSG